MNRSQRAGGRRAVRYGVAVALSVVVAVLVRNLLPHGAAGIYPLPIAAVLASAWYGGRGPGLVAALASVTAVAYLFASRVEPLGTPVEHALGLLLFAAVAAVVAHFAAARREAEDALVESEARFRLTAENLEEVLWIEALEPRRVLYVSPSYERIWGRLASELYRDPNVWLDAIHPADHAAVSASFERFFGGAGERRFDLEYRIVRPDGKIRWIRDRGVLICDAGGNAHRASGVAEDVTDRKGMEERLRTSEEMWRAAFENNPTMFFMVDAAGRILSVNRFGAEQLGYAADELVGRPVLDVLHEGDREKVLRELETCIARLGSATQWEFRSIRKDGGIVWARASARAVRGPAGNTTVLVASEDVTDARRAEEALARSRAELAHVARVTTIGELAASIAHEINQPLTAIVTSANASLRWLARHPPELDEARQGLAAVVREGSRAGEIVNRVRALARKSSSRREWVDVNELLREVVGLARAEALRTRVSVETELSPAVPRVPGDRVELQQVALNLVVNGIEAVGRTADGPRRLVIRSALDGQDRVLVTVADSGTGLEPGAAARVFDAFFTTKPQGLGMGLAISRSIVEAHGGRIWATPNSPRGATFHFTLPTGASPS